MLYRDGELVRLGDQVRVHETKGVVVLSLDTDEYTDEFKREEWSELLERGVMIRFEKWGLVHYIEPDEDLEFVSRAERPSYT